DREQRSPLVLDGVCLLFRDVTVAAWIGAGPRRWGRSGIGGNWYGVHLGLLALAANQQGFLIQAERQRLCLRLIGDRGTGHDLVAIGIEDLHRVIGQQGNPLPARQEGSVGDIGWRSAYPLELVRVLPARSQRSFIYGSLPSFR